jgi:hypothetical protein
VSRLPTERWRAVNDAIWTKFEDSDEWVVWSPRAGEVHLVTQAVYRLWVLVSDAPRAPADLVTALANETGRAVDDEFTGATLETLTFMDEAGLAHPVSC